PAELSARAAILANLPAKSTFLEHLFRESGDERRSSPRPRQESTIYKTIYNATELSPAGPVQRACSLRLTDLISIIIIELQTGQPRAPSG
ncbi:MAG: hypothetical protein V1895_00420, partial [Parcubacteria group bacterium]